MTWIYQALNVLKLFRSDVKRILNQLVCCLMKTEKDYEEFLELLNKHKVRYCIIGSYALSFHARPRYTKDIDILVEASPENAKKILTVLDKFGFGSLNLRIEDFSEKGNIIQLGYEPKLNNIGFAGNGIVLEGHKCAGCLPPFFIRPRHHRCFQHRRVLVKDFLNLKA